MEIIAYIALGIGILALGRMALEAGAKRARTCELCDGERDPNSAAPGIWQYGVRACDACGAKLHERFKDEFLPPYPPYPPT